jgi:hypothetical protein
MISKTNKHPFVGVWRVTEMQGFDQDMVEMDGPALFRIHDERKGYLEFLGMKVDVDFEMSERDEQPFAEFTWWEPHRLPHCGRGTMTLNGATLEGKIYFHGGDRSVFKAEKLSDDSRQSVNRVVARSHSVAKQPRSKPVSPIPDSVRSALKQRLEEHIAEKWDHTLVSLILRFRGAYAYVDVQDPTEKFPLHLCRLDYLGDPDRWGFAFYKYSDEVYEKSRDWDGSFITTPEKAFDVAATVYLAGG